MAGGVAPDLDPSRGVARLTLNPSDGRPTYATATRRTVGPYVEWTRNI